jgi:DNA-directed RNA polymerase subunit RPC12/RpoP
MPDDQHLAARARKIFSMTGGSLHDYVLVADIEPPRIVRISPAIGFLEIADPALAQACRQFLIEQGVQTFGSFDELNSVFGSTVKKWNFPIEMMFYCNECGKHFDIIVTSKGSQNYRCPACGKIHIFDLDSFAKKAVEQNKKMLRKTRGRR